MPRKHANTFAAVTEDERLFTILEFQKYRLEIAFGPRSERVYGLNAYQTKDGEDVNANEDGTFTLVSSGTVLRRKN